MGARESDKMTVDLQGMRLCKPDVNYSFQQGLLPIAYTAFSTGHVTSAELIRQLCFLFLFISLPI